MAPFYGWGSTASRLEPLRGGSLLFTTKKLMYLPCVDNPSGTNKEGRPSLDSLLIKKVTQFYERDDSSRISPGKRDYSCNELEKRSCAEKTPLCNIR